MEQTRQTFFEWFVGQAFGSDELAPYTAEYAWNSNQMAHAMMGFCLAICWLLFAVAMKPPAGVPVPSGNWFYRRWMAWRALPLDFHALVLFATIPLKEIADLLLDSSTYATSPVEPNIWRLVFDSVTDTSFWWTGMFFAATVVGIFVKGIYRWVVPLVGFFACIAFWYYIGGSLWLNQKRTFDKSGMPFNYKRLVVLAGEREGPQKVTFAESSQIKWPQLEEFRKEVVTNKRPPQRHYVLIGGHPDVRSRLAVSMGCEYAFKIRQDDRDEKDDTDYKDNLVKVRYISASTALERPQLLDEGLKLKKLECVVIDQLDVSTTRPSEAPLEQYLGNQVHVAENSPTKRAAIPMKVFDKSMPNIQKQPPGAQVDKGHSKSVELTPNEIKKIQPLPNFADGLLRTPAPKLLNERLLAIQGLGKKAADYDISTIWVLTGYDGGKDPKAKQEWEKRKNDWIEEIADILEVKKDEPLRIIELADPPE